jgi:hypothetical protein
MAKKKIGIENPGGIFLFFIKTKTIDEKMEIIIFFYKIRKNWWNHGKYSPDSRQYNIPYQTSNWNVEGCYAKCQKERRREYRNSLP